MNVHFVSVEWKCNWRINVQILISLKSTTNNHPQSTLPGCSRVPGLPWPAAADSGGPRQLPENASCDPEILGLE